MKCDTGISWKQYREATKRDEAIPFMCRQCRTEETRQTVRKLSFVLGKTGNGMAH